MLEAIVIFLVLCSVVACGMIYVIKHLDQQEP
jgi:hypothetical protein